MSWGAGVGDFEAGLAQHNDPADPQERKELARRIFETFKGGLTEDMLREKGLGLDTETFERLMDEQRKRAKVAWKGSGDAHVESYNFV